MNSADHLHTYDVIGKGWVRLPNSPVEIRIEWYYVVGHFDIRWVGEDSD